MVILDLSSVSYMDQSAGKNLKEWIVKMDKNFQAAVLLAGPSGRTEAMMISVEMEMSGVFPTVLDALKHVENNHRNNDFFLTSPQYTFYSPVQMSQSL